MQFQLLNKFYILFIHTYLSFYNILTSSTEFNGFGRIFFWNGIESMSTLGWPDCVTFYVRYVYDLIKRLKIVTTCSLYSTMHNLESLMNPKNNSPQKRSVDNELWIINHFKFIFNHRNKWFRFISWFSMLYKVFRNKIFKWIIKM